MVWRILYSLFQTSRSFLLLGVKVQSSSISLNTSEVEAAFKALENIALSIIDEKRRQYALKQENGGSNEEAICLMDLLVQARDDETGATLTDIELKDNACIFLLAGSETTANVFPLRF